MKGEAATKRQLINELATMHQRISELEKSETERTRAEEALRDNEEKYRNLVERANDGICILQDGRATYVNPRLAEMGGETVEQITGASFTDYIDHDELPKIIDRYERRMKGEDVPSIYETVFRRKDGSKVYVELNAGTIAYQGRIADLVFVRDITERKQAEEALRESEKKYRMLIENANEAIIVAQDDILKFCNPKAVELMGYSEEELISMPFAKLSHPDDRKTVIERHRRRIDGEELPHIYSFRSITGDGNIKWLESNAVLISWEGRSAILNFLSDISERKRAEEALRESEEKYRALVEFTEDSVYLVDRDRKYLFLNEKYLSRLHLSKDKAIGRAYDEFHSIEEQKEFAEKVGEVFRSGRFVHYEHMSSRDGRYFLRTLSPVKEPNGNIRAVTVISKDITERKRTEELIQRERETFFSILNKAPYGVVLISKNGRYLYTNPEFTNITGYTLKDVPAGKDWFRKAWPDQKYRHETIATWKRDFTRSGVDRTFSIVCKDGTVKEIEFRTTILDDSRIIVMLSDITERMRLEQQLTYMATHDVLTDLPNRVLFNDRLTLTLAQAYRHSHKLAVMMLDLDRFKDINDTLGHSVGDRLLKSVGDRLRSSLRKSDSVARMGGDEFLFLLPEIAQADDSPSIARKILEILQEPFLVNGHELRITASIGVAVYPDDGADADTLIKTADIAMYSAKRQGRNIFQRYSSAMKIETVE